MSQSLSLKLIGLTACAAILGACASTPLPVQSPVQVQKRAPEKPVFVKPAPVKPVEKPMVAEALPPMPAGPTPGSVDDFVNAAGDRIFFGYNQYDLTTEARNVLRGQAQWLGQYPSVIAVIGGHADERGTREYNLALGARRADAVKDFLVSQGVDPNRITTVSYGKERPIDGRSNEQAWALNRNGHTAIVSGANS